MRISRALLSATAMLTFFSVRNVASARSCGDAGGRNGKHGDCLCAITQSYINPALDSCVDLAITRVAELNRSHPLCTGTIGSASSEPILPSIADVCAKPAETLCNLEINQKFRDFVQRLFLNVKAYSEARQSTTMARFVGALSPDVFQDASSDEQSCATINAVSHPELAKNCFDIMDKIVAESGAATDHKEVIKIFEVSKLQVIEYLENKIKRISPGSNSSTQEATDLRRIQEKIRQARIIFDSSRGDFYVDASSNPEKPEVTVRGLASIAKENPELLHGTFLHELGHIVDPYTYYDNYTKSASVPFNESLNCLKGFTQAVDIECVRRSISQMDDPSQRPVFDMMLNEIEKHPFDNLDLPFAADGKGCANAQLTETFADFIEGEVLPRNSNGSGRDALISIMSATSGLCTQTLIDNEETDTQDSHPPGAKRIESLLSNPAVRRRLGCTTASSSFSPAPGNKPVSYCGDEK